MLRATRGVLGKVLVCAQAGPKGVTPSTLSTFTAASKLGEITAVVSGKYVNPPPPPVHYSDSTQLPSPLPPKHNNINPIPHFPGPPRTPLRR